MSGLESRSEIISGEEAASDRRIIPEILMAGSALAGCGLLCSAAVVLNMAIKNPQELQRIFQAFSSVVLH